MRTSHSPPMLVRTLTAAAALAVAALALPPSARAAAAAQPLEHRFADLDGVEVFYREAGPRNAPALLLLHGFPSSSHMYRHLVPALADRYHVIAPDYPGFGYSDFPDPKRYRYSFDAYARRIQRFTEQLGLTRYGRRGPFFTPAGAEAYRRDLPDAELHLLDAGHFALETHGGEIASLIRDFLGRRLSEGAHQ